MQTQTNKQTKAKSQSFNALKIKLKLKPNSKHKFNRKHKGTSKHKFKPMRKCSPTQNQSANLIVMVRSIANIYANLSQTQTYAQSKTQTETYKKMQSLNYTEAPLEGDVGLKGDTTPPFYQVWEFTCLKKKKKNQKKS